MQTEKMAWVRETSIKLFILCIWNFFHAGMSLIGGRVVENLSPTTSERDWPSVPVPIPSNCHKKLLRRAHIVAKGILAPTLRMIV